MRRHLRTKKILVASIGVATVTYVACSSGGPVGNLMAVPPADAAKDGVIELSDAVVGNLVGPIDVFVPDASEDVTK